MTDDQGHGEHDCKRQQILEVAHGKTELRRDIRNKVVELARAMGKKADGIHDDDILLEKGFLDSASVLELLVWLEGETGGELDPDEVSLDNFGSISRMVTFLSARP